MTRAAASSDGQRARTVVFAHVAATPSADNGDVSAHVARVLELLVHDPRLEHDDGALPVRRFQRESLSLRALKTTAGTSVRRTRRGFAATGPTGRHAASAGESSVGRSRPTASPSPHADVPRRPSTKKKTPCSRGGRQPTEPSVEPNDDAFSLLRVECSRRAPRQRQHRVLRSGLPRRRAALCPFDAPGVERRRGWEDGVHLTTPKTSTRDRLHF